MKTTILITSLIAGVLGFNTTSAQVAIRPRPVIFRPRRVVVVHPAPVLVPARRVLVVKSAPIIRVAPLMARRKVIIYR